MNRPVPLIRRFISISPHYQKGDVELETFWSVLGQGERTEWGALRDLYRCVILADAGAGKTFELRAEAVRLAERGRPAFFIRIEDIDEAFGTAFEVGTPEAFEQWLSGTGDAWFFLDSVDEVRLEAPRAFETAIRAFAARIHDARQRAHVYISSRPYAWRSQTDRALIEELLPYELPVGESTGAPGAKPATATKIEAAQSSLSLYRLAPLDPDDIRIFAGHRGASNIDAFIDALERTNLFVLAQLPFDLDDLLAVWRETGSLDSRLAVLERGLERRLAPPTGTAVMLTLDKAMEGARRLAIATTLTSEANIAMPGGTGGGLDSTRVLDDWTDDQISALLSRGVFSDAIYSMVRFRHRESRELPDDAQFAEEFIVSLIGGRREGGVGGNKAWNTPEHLKALYVLMHRHIRSAEDLNRADGGTYSPTTRDNAQEARNNLFNLLAAIPGEASYREILALAEEHPEPSYRVHMRRRAHERAVEDSDRDWSIADVMALASRPIAPVG